MLLTDKKSDALRARATKRLATVPTKLHDLAYIEALPAEICALCDQAAANAPDEETREHALTLRAGSASAPQRKGHRVNVLANDVLALFAVADRLAQSADHLEAAAAPPAAETHVDANDINGDDEN